MTLTILTTCSGCGRELETSDHEHAKQHPGCPAPAPTELDRLTAEFVQAVLDGRDQDADNLEQRIAAADPGPQLGAAALWYATNCGWPVFPLKPGTKTPATPRGFLDATTDTDRILRYWEANPNANIGVPTGLHFDVIDIDVPDGIQSYQQLLASALTIHGRAVTSSSGLHLLITPTNVKNKVRTDPGVDYRGKGGYIVAPPSWLGRNGTAWSWLDMPSPHIKDPK